MDQAGFGKGSEVRWSLHKFVEEPEFGPEPFVHTVFLVGVLYSVDEHLHGEVKIVENEFCRYFLADS